MAFCNALIISTLRRQAKHGMPEAENGRTNGRTRHADGKTDSWHDTYKGTNDTSI